jgi:hypothetical protein
MSEQAVRPVGRRRPAPTESTPASRAEQPVRRTAGFESFIHGVDWMRLDPASPTDCLRTPCEDMTYTGG